MAEAQTPARGPFQDRGKPTASAAPFAPAEMADHVAAAINRTLGGEDDFADLPADEKAGLILAAHAAIEAHDAFLIGRGFRLLPPSTIPAPKCAAEAEAMRAAAEAFLREEKRRQPLVIEDRRRLIVPR